MPTPFTVTREVGPLACWEWRGAPPIALLLHGLGNYARYWDRLAIAVAGRLRLVAYDARGHGASAKPAQGYAREDLVADALAVLDAREIDSAVVVGHSMGGRHGMALAAAHPGRVRALVLVDIGPELMSEGAERAARLTEDRPASFPDEAAAEAWLRETSPGYDDGVYSERLRWLFAEARPPLVFRSSQAALGAIRAAARKVRREDHWRTLERLRCPTLVVRGTRSNVLAAATAQAMVGRLRDGRLAEVDAGHNPPLERPGEVADLLVGLARGS